MIVLTATVSSNNINNLDDIFHRINDLEKNVLVQREEIESMKTRESVLLKELSRLKTVVESNQSGGVYTDVVNDSVGYVVDTKTDNTGNVHTESTENDDVHEKPQTEYGMPSKGKSTCTYTNLRLSDILIHQASKVGKDYVSLTFFLLLAFRNSCRQNFVVTLLVPVH